MGWAPGARRPKAKDGRLSVVPCVVTRDRARRPEAEDAGGDPTETAVADPFPVSAVGAVGG